MTCSRKKKKMAIPFLEMETEAHNGFMTCSVLGLEIGPQFSVWDRVMPLAGTLKESFIQRTDDLLCLFALAKYRRILKVLSLGSEPGCPRTGERRRKKADEVWSGQRPPGWDSTGTTHLARGYGPQDTAPVLRGHGRKRSPRTTRRVQNRLHLCSAGPSIGLRGTGSSARVTPERTQKSGERPCSGLRCSQGGA